MYIFFLSIQNEYRGEKMKNMRLKNWVVYSLYGLGVLTLVGCIYLINYITKPLKDIDDFKYVDDTIIDTDFPVVAVYDTIMRPYVANNVSIARNFYDYLGEEENQKNSLIYYEGTYIPNTGTDYSSEEIFDVVSVLAGNVSNITENTLTGKVIEITHDNGLVTVYQSLSETNVVVGDTVIRGQVIGKSGLANISSSLGNHLHFEVILNGVNINPENCYDKKIEEL